MPNFLKKFLNNMAFLYIMKRREWGVWAKHEGCKFACMVDTIGPYNGTSSMRLCVFSCMAAQLL